MNLQKCEKGHYYDQDKFVRCPYCAVKGQTLKDTVQLDGMEENYTKKKCFDNEPESLQKAVIAAMEQLKNREKTHLPVGILVSVGGVQRGNVFPLYYGRNYVERCEDGIHVGDERREKASLLTAIVYYPESNEFMIHPEEGQIRVGDMLLQKSVSLSGYERISVLDVQFLFVPICGEKFCWI